MTIYVSEDEPFSRPLLEAFEKESGIRVHALYDTEESKSSGLINRLIAEKANPQADLYWANEPIRAEVLRKKGVLAPYHSPNADTIPKNFLQKEWFWSGFSARIRLFVVNQKATQIPHSILDYAKSDFRAKGVIANPLFGTTTAHIAALFVTLGDQKAKAFLNALKKNQTAISTSNGESADLVKAGKYDFSLVDSDDAISRLRSGAPIRFVYPDQEANGLGLFVVPNCVMLIKGAKHPQNAKKLFDFLLSAKAQTMLAKEDCAQIPLSKDLSAPDSLKPISALKVMQVDYAKVAQKLLAIQPFLKRWLDH